MMITILLVVLAICTSFALGWALGEKRGAARVIVAWKANNKQIFKAWEESLNLFRFKPPSDENK